MNTTIQPSLNQSSSLQPRIVTSSIQSKFSQKRPATQALQAGKNKRSKKLTPQLQVITPILRKVNSVDNVFPPQLELQYRPYDRLWESVKKNNVSSLQELLTPETSLNTRYGKKGWTLLQYAVQLGHKEIVDFLIQQGVDIHAQTPEEGWSALHLACSYYPDKKSQERIFILQKLMEAGADLNQVTQDGWTPLHWAAQQGSYNSVQCLIHGDAEVNASTRYEEDPDEQGVTPLLLAIKKRHDKVVELLLDNGADPDQKSANHIRPLHLAIATRQPAIVNLLARKKVNVNIKISNSPQKEGMTLLHLALLQDNLESVISLIKAGADVNQHSGDEGWIPLQLTDNINLINILLENSEIQINATSRDQWSALHWHIDEDNLPIVELLLEKKPNLSLKTEEGDTPLALAKRVGNTTMIEKLQDAIPQKVTHPLPIKKRFNSLTGLKTSGDIHETLLFAASSQHMPVTLRSTSIQEPQHHHTPEEIKMAQVIAQLNTAISSHSMNGTPSPMIQPPSTPTSRVRPVIVHTDQLLVNSTNTPITAPSVENSVLDPNVLTTIQLAYTPAYTPNDQYSMLDYAASLAGINLLHTDAKLLNSEAQQLLVNNPNTLTEIYAKNTIPDPSRAATECSTRTCQLALQSHRSKRQNRHTSTAKKEEVRRLIKEGTISRAQAAKLMDRHPTTIGRWLSNTTNGDMAKPSLLNHSGLLQYTSSATTAAIHHPTELRPNNETQHSLTNNPGPTAEPGDRFLIIDNFCSLASNGQERNDHIPHSTLTSGCSKSRKRKSSPYGKDAEDSRYVPRAKEVGLARSIDEGYLSVDQAAENDGRKTATLAIADSSSFNGSRQGALPNTLTQEISSSAAGYNLAMLLHSVNLLPHAQKTPGNKIILFGQTEIRPIVND